MNKEFILKYELHKKTKKLLLYSIPFFIFIFFIVFHILYNLTKIELSFYNKNIFIFSFLNFLLKISAFGLMFFFISIIFFTFYFIISIKKNNIIGIVNKQGLKLKFHKFIPWEYVEKIEIFKPSYSPLAPIQLALWLKSDKKKRRNLSISTKIGILFSSITGYQHITFGSLNTDQNLEILKFAQECLKKDSF